MKAFTLIELMIAIAIFATVMIAIYSSWSAILRASRTGLNAAAEAQRTRMALRAVEEALASVQVFSMNLPLYAFLADTTGDFATLSFVARLSSSFPGSGAFPGQPLRRVTFVVKPGPDTRPQLLLQQTPVLEPPEASPAPYTIVLSPHIKTFAAEFWDARAGEWALEWLNTNAIPKMVRVAVDFGPENPHVQQKAEVSSRVIYMAATPVPPPAGVAGAPGAGQPPPPGGAPGRGGRTAPNENAANPDRFNGFSETRIGGKGGTFYSNPQGGFPPPSGPFRSTRTGGRR